MGAELISESESLTSVAVLLFKGNDGTRTAIDPALKG